MCKRSGRGLRRQATQRTSVRLLTMRDRLSSGTPLHRQRRNSCTLGENCASNCSSTAAAVRRRSCLAAAGATGAARTAGRGCPSWYMLASGSEREPWCSKASTPTNTRTTMPLMTARLLRQRLRFGAAPCADSSGIRGDLGGGRRRWDSPLSGRTRGDRPRKERRKRRGDSLRPSRRKEATVGDRVESCAWCARPAWSAGMLAGTRGEADARARAATSANRTDKLQPRYVAPPAPRRGHTEGGLLRNASRNGTRRQIERARAAAKRALAVRCRRGEFFRCCECSGQLALDLQPVPSKREPLRRTRSDASRVRLRTR